ncbi:MAG: helix-turn-helix domain-containing protein [Xanthobacteraceae bacterium]
MERTEHLSEKLLARRWGLSHRTLERWRHAARGPAFLKVGGRIVYRIEDIETYEASRRRQPTALPSQAAGCIQ